MRKGLRSQRAGQRPQGRCIATQDSVCCGHRHRSTNRRHVKRELPGRWDISAFAICPGERSPAPDVEAGEAEIEVGPLEFEYSRASMSSSIRRSAPCRYQRDIRAFLRLGQMIEDDKRTLINRSLRAATNGHAQR